MARNRNRKEIVSFRLDPAAIVRLARGAGLDPATVTRDQISGVCCSIILEHLSDEIARERQAARVPVASIEIGFTESEELQATIDSIGNTWSTWEAANAAIRDAAREAPAGRAYDKTDVRITWTDGRTFARRVDINRAMASVDAPLSDEIREYLAYRASKAGAMFTAEQSADARRILTTYDLGG